MHVWKILGVWRKKATSAGEQEKRQEKDLNGMMFHVSA